jgi:hypothetical protein
MGGMPMTISTQLSDQKCQNNFSEGGWRNCPTESDTLNRVGFTSQAWKDHNTQIAYYTVSSVINPSASNNLLNRNFKGSCVNDSAKKNENVLNQRCPPIALSSLLKLINLSAGSPKTNVSDREKLEFFQTIILPRVGSNQISLNKVKRGDYVWIDTGGVTNHGLLVVGWETIKSCQDVIIPPLSFNNLLSESPQKNLTFAMLEAGMPIPTSIYVPYVIDYSYGVNPNSSPLQSTVPRPFYCTRFNESGLGQGRTVFGSNHTWRFFNFPDVVAIPPQVLYADPTWQWTSSSR